MSTPYIDAVLNEKKFTGNIVIKIGASSYFSIRQPDSGLSIASPYDKSVISLTVDPTSVDVVKVTTTFSSCTFRLSDKGGIVSALVLGDAKSLVGLPVKIYLGRSNESMDFADYFELPITYVLKLTHQDNTYTIAAAQSTQRMDRPIYAQTSATGVDILVGTTTWTMRDDISGFPSSGVLKCESEFVSYASLDLVNNRFNGVIRGVMGSVPATHAQFTDCVWVETITDNPLNILMKILTSGGGGGAYDVLQSGLAIDHTLIDLADIGTIRDELFSGVSFTLSLYSIDSALTFMEDELLMPCGLRFSTSRASLITFAALNTARFVEEEDVIDEDTITKYPQWTLDAAKVANSIVVSWDFDEPTALFKQVSTFADATSISNYGPITPLTYTFHGVKNDAGGLGLAFINKFGTLFLDRNATPTPVIQINTQLDKSLQNVGDKAYLVSSKIPAYDGSLNFASDLEIISRSINQTTGDVQFKLAFTSFTNMRSAYIAPSDFVTSFLSQHEVNVALGRGALYLVGFFMRLWDDVAQAYCTDSPNMIIAVEQSEDHMLTEAEEKMETESDEDIVLDQASNEDTIVFQSDWVTTLIPGQHKIRFATYDDCSDAQKRFGFISAGGANFDDGKPTYKVTY